MTDRTWKPDMVETLQQAWQGTESCAAIGRLIGVSKNAVVGKAKRLGLPDRPVLIPHSTPKASKSAGMGDQTPPRACGKPRVAKVGPHHVAKTAPMSVAPALAPTISPGLPSPPSEGCHWPMWWHHELPTHRYCGEARDRLVDAYCPRHMEKAVVRVNRLVAA